MVGVTAVILQAFQVAAYTARSNFPAVILLILTYCTASISINHCAEKLFSDSSMSQLVVLCGHIAIGIICLLIMVLLEALYYSLVR